VNIKKIKELMDKLEQTDLAEIEISGIFSKVVIRKTTSGAVTSFSTFQPVYQPPSLPQGEQQDLASGVSKQVLEKNLTEPTIEVEKAKEEEKVENIAHITSPMVGTFYRAPAPGAEPYVKEGDRVTKGTIVCIIEAMKLMNEIESEQNGIIKEIHVENAKPVEYGQILFTIQLD